MHFPKTLIKNRFYKHRQCYTNSPFPFALSRPSISHAVSVSVSKPSGYAHANHVLDPTLGCLHHSLGRATYRFISLNRYFAGTTASSKPPRTISETDSLHKPAMPNLTWTQHCSALLDSVCIMDLQTQQKFHHYSITIKSKCGQGKDICIRHISHFSTVLPKYIRREEP
jgi:hypothetical protein